MQLKRKQVKACAEFAAVMLIKTYKTTDLKIGKGKWGAKPEDLLKKCPCHEDIDIAGLTVMLSNSKS